MKITRIEQIAVNIPYLERVLEHLQKGWGYGNRATDEEFRTNEPQYRKEWEESSPPSVETTVFRVHTADGLVGVGEGRALSDEQAQEYIGKSPFDFVMDDSTGPLQIAFYDLMGQATGLPVARMLGPSRAEAPLAYWSHCFPPEVLREEARIAVENGYTVHKFKRRAHTDVVEQVECMLEVIPDDYEITIDANATFGTPENAISFGRKLEKFPQVKCLESPIDQDNVDGYKLLKKELRFQLAHHYGSPDPLLALHSEAYDHFVIDGWVAGVMRSAHVAALRDKTFWMQMGQTGITAAFMVHLAAAVPNATLGHVSLHHLLEHSLLAEPLAVREGQTRVPDEPGLGVELDMDALERFRR